MIVALPMYRLHGCCVSARSQKLKPYVASPDSINLPADSLITADRQENRQTTICSLIQVQLRDHRTNQL
jgi:hypothetical protein